jgi:hypothetical protein
MRTPFIQCAAVISMFAATVQTSGCSKDSCIEKQKPECVCTMIYDPVCGCNGKTYGNGCEAQCAGITEYTKGECGKK